MAAAVTNPVERTLQEYMDKQVDLTRQLHDIYATTRDRVPGIAAQARRKEVQPGNCPHCGESLDNNVSRDLQRPTVTECLCNICNFRGGYHTFAYLNGSRPISFECSYHMLGGSGGLMEAPRRDACAFCNAAEARDERASRKRNLLQVELVGRQMYLQKLCAGMGIYRVPSSASRAPPPPPDHGGYQCRASCPWRVAATIQEKARQANKNLPLPFEPDKQFAQHASGVIDLVSDDDDD
jgi:hypothetical protein